MTTRSIVDALRHVQGGEFLDRCSDAMQQLALAVDETGKGGKLTIEIGVAKLTRGGAVTLKGKVTVKRPAEQPHEGIFWVSPEGNLLTEDPKQQRLELRAVEQPEPGALRTVGGD